MDIFYEEESEKIAFPYYLVEYVDDERKIHLAVVQDDLYLRFLKDRFFIIEIKYIKENLTKEKIFDII